MSRRTPEYVKPGMFPRRKYWRIKDHLTGESEGE